MEGAGCHDERCPFCGQIFNIRDLGQVLLHPATTSRSVGSSAQKENSIPIPPEAFNFQEVVCAR